MAAWNFVLLAAVRGAGLDADRAQFVPAVIVNDQHLISGGQAMDAYEQGFRQIANEARAGGA